MRYLDRVEITPDNNATERAIKTFVIGRNYAESRIMLSTGQLAAQLLVA